MSEAESVRQDGRISRPLELAGGHFYLCKDTMTQVLGCTGKEVKPPYAEQILPNVTSRTARNRENPLFH